MLNVIVHGTPTGKPPLIIAHGLFGSARNWGTIARLLSAERQIIAVDMRNHGASPRDADHSYPALAGDLAEVIDAHGGKADMLGHSMGGKAAMVLALTMPERVGRLIVADIAPVTYDHPQMHYIRAMQSVDLGGVKRRSDADSQLARSVDDQMLRTFFLQSLNVSSDGAAWRLNLDALADQMPLILGFPELDATYGQAVLFLAGETSDYLAPEHWPAALAKFPAAQRKVLPGTNHWLHADAPQAFAGAVATFLDA